jgi:hypothetical protein
MRGGALASSLFDADRHERRGLGRDPLQPSVTATLARRRRLDTFPLRQLLGSFAFLLIRGRGGRSPDTIAEDALSGCRAEERALAAFSQELMPIVKDRMKAWLVSGGQVPENLWW